MANVIYEFVIYKGSEKRHLGQHAKEGHKQILRKFYNLRNITISATRNKWIN